MDVVLAAIHLEPSPRAVPLGPAMLASALRGALGAAVTVHVLDLFLDQDPAACARRILACGPDCVGFSMYVWNRPLALATGAELKRLRPDLVVFAGGAEASADPDGVLGAPGIDFVLPGEGEELIVAALGRLLQGDTPAALQAAARPAPVADLATLASPYLDGSLDPAAYSGVLWELSRGCPFQCDFCFEARGGTGVRRIPMARLEAELRLFEAKGVSQVFVLDPTFNADPARAKDVLRLIAEVAPAIHFFFEVRSEFLDRELAAAFAGVRCTLQIGLQSAHDPVLRNVNRRLDRRRFEAKVLLLHQAGAAYGFDLIYGLPGDDLPGFLASLDFALALAPNHLDIFPLAVLPGTRLAETAAGFGLRHQDHSPYLVTGSPGFDAAAMAEAGRIGAACDVFYNQGRAVPWFGMLMGGLELAPSELFRRFAGHRERHPGTDPLELQCGFLQELFTELGSPAMGSVAADLATWFGHAAALAEDPAAGPRRVRFRHDPQALLEQLELGITELEDLSFVLPAAPCEALLDCAAGAARIAAVTPD